MKKKELVYCALLYDLLEKKNARFTQLGLSRTLGISLCAVHYALSPLVKMGALRVFPRGFSVIDARKILLYWASIRTPSRDVVHKTRVDSPIAELERSLPPGVLFGAYSGYRFRFDDVPADYSEVYAYAPAHRMEELIHRFPAKEGIPNLIILRADPPLERLSDRGTVPVGLLYADLWNLGTWYAKEFIHALERRFHGVLE